MGQELPLSRRAARAQFRTNPLKYKYFSFYGPSGKK